MSEIKEIDKILAGGIANILIDPIRGSEYAQQILSKFAALETENASLKERLNKSWETGDKMSDDVRKYFFENADLRNDNAGLLAQHDAYEFRISNLCIENAALQAENEKLKLCDGYTKIETHILEDMQAAIENSQADNEAIRTLMNIYNVGGWTDAIEPMKRALKAEADKKALAEALETIRDMTDADNDESYRSDDREGCLDTVHHNAKSALSRHG